MITLESERGCHTFLGPYARAWHPYHPVTRSLTPRTPGLNPPEHVWDYLRENHFRNHALPSLETVGERLCHRLRTLAAQPELVRSLTGFDRLNTPCLSSN